MTDITAPPLHNAPARVIGHLTPPDDLSMSEAVLESTAQGLVATGVDGFQVDAPWTKLRVSERLDGVDRTIVFADGRVFTTTDDDGIDALLPALRNDRFFAIRKTFEASWAKALALSAAAVLIAILAFNAMVPVIADIAAANTSAAVDQNLGRQALAQLRGVTGPSSTPSDVQASLQQEFQRLADAANFRPGSVRLYVVDGGPIGANALAVPGGAVFMTDQMIALSRHEDELIGVLAHELGHIHHRHGLEKVYRAAAVSALLYLFIGGDGGIIGLAGLGSQLLTSAYSRDMEREADDYAVDLLKQLGYDPTALGDLLVRLSEQANRDGEPGLLDSHPMSDERLDRMRARAAQP